MGKQEEMSLLKALDWTKGKCTMKNWKPEQVKCLDICPTYGKSQDKTIKRVMKAGKTKDSRNFPQQNGCGICQKRSL